MVQAIEKDGEEAFGQITDQSEQTAPEPAIFKRVEHAGIVVTGIFGRVLFMKDKTEEF